jgi:hypothetical protein
VLLELHRVLGEYRDRIAVVGGWVPELLLRGEHVGSMDVDLALDHLNLTEVGYRAIRDLLVSAGYREGSQPFVFFRDVPAGERTLIVQVDLLAGEYEGSGKGHRTQKVQDVRARKARGCDLAFAMLETVTVEGALPGGGRDSAIVRVASVVSFLVMKGMAMYDRAKEKDAWDIDYCLRSFPGGLDAAVRAITPHMGHGLVREGLGKIAAKFASPEHVGPRHVADFDELTDPDERAIVQRDAHERVAYLLKGARAERRET